MYPISSPKVGLDPLYKTMSDKDLTIVGPVLCTFLYSKEATLRGGFPDLRGKVPTICCTSNSINGNDPSFIKGEKHRHKYSQLRPRFFETFS